MRRLLALLLLGLLSGCSPAAEPPADVVGDPVCDGGRNAPAATVHRGIAVPGEAVNSLRYRDGELYIVESGDNTVSRFDVATQRLEPLVDVGNERNPWDLWVGEDELWITNYLTNTVTVADRSSGEVLAEVEDSSFESPSGITALGDFVYVSNVQFRGDGEYGPGSVTVIGRSTRQVLGSLTTRAKNPQALDVADGRIVVVDSGAIAFDADGSFAASPAAVELWTPTTDPLAPDVTEVTMEQVTDRTIGIPGRPAHQAGTDVIYFPSGTAPVVFALDLTTETWSRGADDPIRLYDSERDALNHAAIADGVLYVTAFNEDRMFLVDTTCDEVLDAVQLEDSSMLAGPHGVVPVQTSTGVDAYFVLAQANELGRVRLDFGD